MVADDIGAAETMTAVISSNPWMSRLIPLHQATQVLRPLLAIALRSSVNVIRMRFFLSRRTVPTRGGNFGNVLILESRSAISSNGQMKMKRGVTQVETATAVLLPEVPRSATTKVEAAGRPPHLTVVTKYAQIISIFRQHSTLLQQCGEKGHWANS